MGADTRLAYRPPTPASLASTSAATDGLCYMDGGRSTLAKPCD